MSIVWGTMERLTQLRKVGEDWDMKIDQSGMEKALALALRTDLITNWATLVKAWIGFYFKKSLLFEAR